MQTKSWEIKTDESKTNLAILAATEWKSMTV